MNEWMDLEYYPGPSMEQEGWKISMPSNGMFSIDLVDNSIKVGDLYFGSDGKPMGVIVSVSGATATISTDNGPM